MMRLCSIVLLAFTATAFAQIPSQFSGLKNCTVTTPWPAEATSGDCTAYASPADAEPTVYDGTAGTIYTDPVFGTKIKRITPQAGMSAGNYSPRDAPNEAWSKNGTYLKLTGPGGGDYLFHGTDPYAYIRHINVANDGADELVTIWSFTNDCILINTYQRTIRKVDVCNADAITNLGTFNTLTDTASNSLDLLGNNLVIHPYAYCGVSTDDTKFAAKIIDGGGSVYGFAVFSLDIVGNTASKVWFHKITSPGDLVENSAPANKLPGATCISPGGDYVAVSWTTFVSYPNISSMSCAAGTVTVHTSSGLQSGVTNGSTINIEGLGPPDGAWNGQFTVASTGSQVLTYSQTCPGAAPSSVVNGTVQYKYYGTEIFSASGSGGLIAQVSRDESHMDQMLLADGSEALMGEFLSYDSTDYMTFNAVKYSAAGAFNFGNCWNLSGSPAPCGAGQPVSTAYRTRAWEQSEELGAWHVSSQNTLSTNGLKGWVVWSTYNAGSQVDCSSQAALCSEIIAVPLDGSNQNIRIAHHQSNTGGDQYYAEPHALANRDFTKVLWGSTWRNGAGTIDAFLVELPSTTTINASSCSSTDVQSAINAASTGDTVVLPACTTSNSWGGSTASPSIDINKAITLQGAGAAVPVIGGTYNEPTNGNSCPLTATGGTTILLTGSYESIHIHKQASGAIRIQGINFSSSLGDNSSHMMLIDDGSGNWTTNYPVIFYQDSFCGSFTNMGKIDSPGGVIFSHNYHVGSYNAGGVWTPVHNTSQSWATDDTLGSHDTTGMRNIYFEDNTFYTGNIIDCDSSCRVVFRHNQFYYTAFNSHGYDTSLYGMRQFELYNNDFHDNNPSALGPGGNCGGSGCLGNVQFNVWVRGGTGIIANNTMDDLTDRGWGTKPQVRFSLWALADPTVLCSKGDASQCSCSTISYPIRGQAGQIGQNWSTASSFFTDPVYMWGNSCVTHCAGGGGWTDPWAYDSGVTQTCSPTLTLADWMQSGRDYVNSSLSGGSAKAGYTPYTYPHPLVGGGGGGGGGGGAATGAKMQGSKRQGSQIQ